MRPLFLFTDFGWNGPYVGQMIAAIMCERTDMQVISLMHDAPRMRPDLAAYLLPGCVATLPAGAIVVAVVDPGVGGERAAVVAETKGLTLVGPDNGLLSRLPGILRVHRIEWRPDRLSASFHGRDLFAPVAARLALGRDVAMAEIPVSGLVGADWIEDMEAVVYVDNFGNAMTGIRIRGVERTFALRVAGVRIAYARTFCEVAAGEVFWYENSIGLVEIAVSGGSAAKNLGLAIGDRILID